MVSFYRQIEGKKRVGSWNNWMKSEQKNLDNIRCVGGWRLQKIPFSFAEFLLENRVLKWCETREFGTREISPQSFSLVLILLHSCVALLFWHWKKHFYKVVVYTFWDAVGLTFIEVHT